MNIIGSFLKANYRTLFSAIVLSALFYISIAQSYLLFHTIVELFSIVVAFAVFIIAWNSRYMQDNPYLRFVGIAYLSIAALDLLHALTFKGMNVIPADGHFFANQFWVATRFLEALTFLGAFVVLKYRRQVNADLIFLGYFLITVAITLSILVYKTFPACYVEGFGQTDFKVYAEYLIIILLLLTCYYLYKFRNRFSRPVYLLLLTSVAFTIISEFCFTLYVSNYSTANEIGHYAKLIAFFLIYKANVEKGFVEPTNYLFKGLQDNELKFRTLAQNIPDLEVQNAMKDRLFSIIAHDLKNPFTAILSFSEIIAKNGETMEPAKAKKMGQRINDAGKQALYLLENLLNWSRFQSGLMKPDLQLVDIQLLLNEALLFAAPAAHQKDIDLLVKDTAALHGIADKHIAETILRNLLSNAIKFTHQGGTVSLQAISLNGEIVVSVADTGIGITTELQKIVLGPNGGHSTKGTENEKGTGLGLVLCKDLVELNGGRIWLESIPGEGTTFYFTIPERPKQALDQSNFSL